MRLRMTGRRTLTSWRPGVTFLLLFAAFICALLIPASSATASHSTTGNVALLAIDLQNSFSAGKSAADIKAVVDNVNRLIDAFRADTEGHVFYTQHGYLNGTTCDGHATYKAHWAARGSPDCRDMVAGTRNFDLVPGLRPPVDGEPVLRKEVYSAFFASDLDALLRERAVDTVVLAGWGFRHRGGARLGCGRRTAHRVLLYLRAGWGGVGWGGAAL